MKVWLITFTDNESVLEEYNEVWSSREKAIKRWFELHKSRDLERDKIEGNFYSWEELTVDKGML